MTDTGANAGHDSARPEGARVLRGADLAGTIRTEIAAAVKNHIAAGLTPRLAVVVGSDDPAVIKYAGSKGRMAEKLGVALDVHRLDPRAGQSALEETVKRLSEDPLCHGILLELPMDPHLDAEAAISLIDPHKDVDGLTAQNLGMVAAGQEQGALCPVTPVACIRLAESHTELAGKRAVVIGRGRSVGRALAPMLVNRDVTVTICHTRTPDLADAIAPCDLVFVAAGRANLITGDLVRRGQTVVDAGINIVDGAVTGDVHAASVAPKVAAYSPVPGGVGPLTSTLVFDNLLRAITLQHRPEG